MSAIDPTPQSPLTLRSRRHPDANTRDVRDLESKVLKLKGRDWQNYSPERREMIVDECFQYWRSRRFPYYRLNDAEILKEYNRLKGVGASRTLLGGEIQMSMVGLRLANFFHPQMWDVPAGGRRPPMDCFEDDKSLREVIRKALRIWPDRYSVNESNLRRMLKTFSHTAGVSNFRPTAAKAIYERYSKSGDDVLDFSAGYGGRLLGCMPLVRRYIGVDPSREQIKGLNSMRTKVGKLARVEALIEIHQACAEEFMPRLEGGSVALVFSSPPYFNHERYSNERSQSYLKFPVYGDWLEGFLGKIVAESRRVLKPGGYLILNVADINGYNIIQDALRIASRYFRLIETLRLRLGHIPYLRGRAREAFKYEPVFVFRKGRR